MESSRPVWDDLSAAFTHATENGATAAANKLLDLGSAALADLKQADVDWFFSALGDSANSPYAFAVLRHRHPPAQFRIHELKDDFRLTSPWLPLLIRAVVYEVDPSNNAHFIAPAVCAFGAQAAYEGLLTYLEHGTNFEKAGAANATYWMFGYQGCNDLLERAWILELQTFLESDDLPVRQSMILAAPLRWAPALKDPPFPELIARAERVTVVDESDTS